MTRITLSLLTLLSLIIPLSLQQSKGQPGSDRKEKAPKGTDNSQYRTVQNVPVKDSDPYNVLIRSSALKGLQNNSSDSSSQYSSAYQDSSYYGTGTKSQDNQSSQSKYSDPAPKVLELKPVQSQSLSNRSSDYPQKSKESKAYINPSIQSKYDDFQ